MIQTIFDSHFGEECLDLAISLVRPEIYVLTSSKMIYRWDYVKKKLIDIKELTFPARKIVISDNNDFLAVGSKNGVLEIINPKTLEIRSTFLEEDKEITCLAFSKSSDLLAVGFANGEIKLLSAPLKFKPLVAVVSTHKSRILCFDFSVDNCFLKVLYEPDYVQIMEISKGAKIDALKNSVHLSWSS
jgi:WD40 repeat protein